MSASRENMLRAQRERDAIQTACKAGGIESNERVTAAEEAYTKAAKQYRAVQREKLLAGICFAVACAAVGHALCLPAWGVTAIFLGGVAVIAILAAL